MKYSSVMRLILDDIFVLPIYSGLVWGLIFCVSDLWNSFSGSEWGNELVEQSPSVQSFKVIWISPVQEWNKKLYIYLCFSIQLLFWIIAILESPKVFSILVQSHFVKMAPHITLHWRHFSWQQEGQWSILFKFVVNGVHALCLNEFKLMILSFYLSNLRQVLEMICSMRCYVILLEKGTYSLIINYMLKKWFQDMFHIDEHLWSQKSGPSNYRCTHNTPHTNIKITSWHSMDYNMVLCRPVPFILRVKKSKLHNVCVCIFSSIYPLKVPVHKIQFYFALCIMELGNQMHFMAVQFMPGGLLEVSELAPFV